MNKSVVAVHSPDRHLALVASESGGPEADRRPAPRFATTTRCRPSELPTTLALRLTEPALRFATRTAGETALELETWVRLAVETARQASRAAELLGMPVDQLFAELDAAASIPIPTRPVIAAPMTAYLRALHGSGSRVASRAAGEGELLIHLSDELAVAWTTEAIDACESLDVWASRQLVAAPRDVVSWEVAAARRGCYLGEWVLAAAAAANRSSARPQA
jgi:hypothetical protein